MYVSNPRLGCLNLLGLEPPNPLLNLARARGASGSPYGDDVGGNNGNYDDNNNTLGNKEF
jgi:hypothetical protein